MWAAAGSDAPRVVSRGCVILAASLIALYLVTIDRVPVVWGDEEYFASTAYSLATGGDAVATVMATAPAQHLVTKFYGPVFPHAGAWALGAGGLNPAAFRSIGVAAVIVAAMAAAVFVRAGGARAPWPAAAAALMLLTPELGGAATNGRPDALAVAFEIAGLASFAVACRTSPALCGSCAGLFWALAALTTPRTLPFIAGLAAGATVAWRSKDEDAAPLRRAVVVAAVTAAVPVIAWSSAAHGSPIAWLSSLAYAASGDPVDAGGIFGRYHAWGATPKTLVSPLVAIVSVAALLIGRKSPNPFPRRTLLAFSATAATVNAALVVILTNRPFENGVYSSPQLLLVALAVCGAAVIGPSRARRAAAVWVAGACLFAGVRTLKYFDTAKSWGSRDPQAVARFFDSHVPEGSVVYSRVPGFFYAVEGAGAAYRSYPRMFPESWMDRVDRGAFHSIDVPADRRFLIWPSDARRFPLPGEFACVGTAMATLRFPERTVLPGARSAWLARLMRTSLYEDVSLYRLPAGCGPGASEESSTLP